MENAALTVIMATHNGAATLPRVLEAYTHVVAPGGPYRLVVVDNASTDETPRILAAHKHRLPLLALRTERRGKNIGLNIGLAHRRGGLVVLTDDDAVPEPGWLIELQRAAAAEPGHDIFGGRIRPLWPNDECPEWIPRLVNLAATYAVTPGDMQRGPVPANRIWGPNMAVRSRVFDHGHRFDEHIGPGEGQYVMGSEVEFTCRLERHGHRAFHVPEAEVGHLIRPGQLDSEWIVRRAYRLGRHMYLQEREELPQGTTLVRGAPRWMWGDLARSLAAAVAARFRRDFDARFQADWNVSFDRGYLDEAARQRHARKP